MSTLEKVQQRCSEKLNQAINENNLEESEKYQTIYNFLLNRRCFLNVNRLTSINILEMIGFSEDEAYQLYEDLISYDNIKGDLVFEERKK